MLTDSGQDHASNGHSPQDRKKSQSQARPRASYPAWSSDLGFVPRVQPLPWREALRQLPRRYRFVLTKPGFEPFLVEMGHAEWKIVWVQVIGYSVIVAFLAYLRTLFSPVSLNTSTSANGLSSLAVAQALSVSTSLGLLLLIPLVFFGTMGLLYGLARALGGHGVFVQQVYTTLLFLVPCSVTISLLGLIPGVGNFLALFLGLLLCVYGVVLQCFAALAVHQMSGGKATTAVILTVLIAFLATLAGVIGLTSTLVMFF